MKDNKFTFNARHVAILALGSSTRCRDKIKEIYKSDELSYYEKYRKSEMKDDLLKEVYPAIDLEHINMLIGIFEEAYEKNDFSNIYEIIKSFNPRILRFVKNKTVVDIDEFMNKEFHENKFRKKVGDGIFFDESINEIEMFNEGAVLIYITKQKEQELTGFSLTRTIGHFKMLADNLARREFSKEIPVEVLNKVNELKAIFGLNDAFINRQSDLGNLFDNMIEYEIERRLSAKIGIDTFKKRGIHPDVYDTTRSSVFEKGLFKYIGTLTSFTSYFDIETNLSMSGVPINSKIVDRILYSCLNGKNGNKIPDSELGLLFVSELFIYSIAYHYNDLKYRYLHSEKEKYFDDITRLKSSLESKYNQLEEKEAEMTHVIENNKVTLTDKDNAITRLQNELREHKRLLEKSEKENHSLQQKLELASAENDMLYELLNRKNEIKVNNEEISYDLKIGFIQSKQQLAFFGGNKTTNNQLKGIFNNIIFFEKNTSDISSISNCGAVFINYQWIKHSLSYKIYAKAKKENIPFYYLTGTNTNKVIDQIYESLQTNVEKEV